MNIEKLIELVKLKPILYTKEASGYKNNNLKKELWNQIGEELHMSGEKCKYKWKGLRAQYLKEKEIQNVPSGSAPTKKKEWKYFQSMQFLNDSIKPRRTHTNIESTIYEEGLSNSAPTTSSALAEDLFSLPSSIDFEEAVGCFSNESSEQSLNNTYSAEQSLNNTYSAEQSLNNFYNDLIKQVQRYEEDSEIDLFFKSLAKIVKAENLTNVQFLQLQTSLTNHLKNELENLKD